MLELEAYHQRRTDQSVRDLNAAMYVSALQSQESDKFYRSEMKRLMGSNEPKLTPEERKLQHEEIVKILGMPK